MYSSLVKAHKCSPVLYVYTNAKSGMLETLRTTTMGTKANIILRQHETKRIKNHGYVMPWKQISVYKLDIIEQHLRQGERVVWIDVDTLLFVSLSSKNINASSWVVGWHHGKRGQGAIYMGQNGDSSSPIKNPANEAQGDLWEVDLDVIQSVRTLQSASDVKPTYDLQGYFSMLLESGKHNLQLLQLVMPNYNFGFQCSNYNHPSFSNFYPLIKENKLHCTDRQGLGFPSPVGSISFTAPTFLDLMLGKTMMSKQSPEVRAWFERYFTTC